MKNILFFLICLCLSSCSSGKQVEKPIDQLSKQQSSRKTIHKGMEQNEVAKLLGSPSIVTKDRDGFSVWVYDKVAKMARHEEGEDKIVLDLDREIEKLNQKQKNYSVLLKFTSERTVKELSFHMTKLK